MIFGTYIVYESGDDHIKPAKNVALTFREFSALPVRSHNLKMAKDKYMRPHESATEKCHI
jgi:hypothetical protein